MDRKELSMKPGIQIYIYETVMNLERKWETEWNKWKEKTICPSTTTFTYVHPYLYNYNSYKVQTNM